MRFLCIVDFGPIVASTQIVSLAVLVAHAVVVFDAVVKEELGTLFTRFPPDCSSLSFVLTLGIAEVGEILPWSNATSRWLSDKIRQHPVRFIQDVSLLLDGHILRVLVRIPVKSNFMACITNSRHILWEGFQGVAWDKPC